MEIWYASLLRNSAPVIRWIFALLSPSGASVSRTSSSLADCCSSATTREPDVKSMPRLSPLPPIDSAPISRITPDSAKKYFDFPM